MADGDKGRVEIEVAIRDMFSTTMNARNKHSLNCPFGWRSHQPV
jgi:hypothetical protein